MKRKTRQLANARFSAKPRRKPSRLGKFWLGFVRMVLWLMLAAFLIFVAGGATWLIRQELFDRNPHFTLHHLDIQVHGLSSRQHVERKLRESGIRRGHTNMFEIDLADLRHRMGAWGEIPSKQVLMRKRLPGTLEITVFERDPVAQLRNRPGPHSRPGPLIDRDGVILPPRESETRRTLPLITPIRVGQIPEYGETIADDQVEVALSLIRTVEETPEYNRLLHINLIQLGFPRADRMLVHLHHQGPFVAGAQIVLPMSMHELSPALKRVETIAFERLESQQMTGFIDASIRQNTPALRNPRY